MKEPDMAVSISRCVKVLRESGFRPHPAWTPFGPTGFIIYTSRMDLVKKLPISGSVIVSQAPFDDVEWLHASVSWQSEMPTYDDLTILKQAVFGPKRHSYQIFPSSDEHVNIHEYTLHLWGKADGQRVLPKFTQEMRSI